jgi:hypothetical protein
MMSAHDLVSAIGAPGSSTPAAETASQTLPPLLIIPAELSTFVAQPKTDEGSNSTLLTSTSSSFDWDNDVLVKDLLSP